MEKGKHAWKGMLINAGAGEVWGGRVPAQALLCVLSPICHFPSEESSRSHRRLTVRKRTDLFQALQVVQDVSSSSYDQTVRDEAERRDFF